MATVTRDTDAAKLARQDQERAAQTDAKQQKKADRERQVAEAQEMLGLMPEQLGFAKSLFYGTFRHDWVMPYPRIVPGKKPAVDAKVAEAADYCQTKLDAAAIDRMADIPRSTIDDLGRLGILGLTASDAVGGHNFTQGDYCRVLEHFGGTCSATSIFINAHHSIGLRALVLFGTEEQKRKWLPPLTSGAKLAAFALTETEAGSDAGNVQTTATPTEDGQAYVLNGTKRYITNAAIADVLTVMARTPDGRGGTKVTAFLVTPDMPGFSLPKPRGEKLGIRGTATGWIQFDNMRVPKENVLGPVGKGLKVALTVLDFGRTTFGACCTGSAKTALKLLLDHATQRRQFRKTLASFDLVRKKVAQAAAWVYAMEAMTYVTAELIDRGEEDFMVETAMLKVWTTEALWHIINDTFQVHGGAAYFTDNALERMLRDSRINQIGEGANDVLRSYGITLVGIKDPGLKLQGVLASAMAPWRGVGPLWWFTKEHARLAAVNPAVPVQHNSLRPYARTLSKLVGRFGRTVRRKMFQYREDLLDEQLLHEPMAEAAMELFAASCALSRLDHERSHQQVLPTDPAQDAAAEYFLRWSFRKTDGHLRALDRNDNVSLKRAAKAVLDAHAAR